MLDHWGLHQTIRQTFRLSVSVPRDHGYGLIHIRNTCKGPNESGATCGVIVGCPHRACQRYYKMLCLAYGAGPILFAEFLEKDSIEYFPRDRALNR